MTSGGRELLKWIALVLMTGDHVAKAFYGGYVPVVSEAGRIAFPLFAVVMAYNLAQPGADLSKSIRRLASWALIAQPAHALVFGHCLPLNVLATFTLAAVAISFASRGNWLAFAAAVVPAPILVDYQWAGIAMVVATWAAFGRRASWAWCAAAAAALCWYNGNAWALLALPVLALGWLSWTLPRTRWAFYGYYVGHLILLLAFSALLPGV